jgi:hypothetical protein
MLKEIGTRKNHFYYRYRVTAYSYPADVSQSLRSLIVRKLNELFLKQFFFINVADFSEVLFSMNIITLYLS